MSCEAEVGGAEVTAWGSLPRWVTRPILGPKMEAEAQDRQQSGVRGQVRLGSEGELHGSDGQSSHLPVGLGAGRQQAWEDAVLGDRSWERRWAPGVGSTPIRTSLLTLLSP